MINISVKIITNSSIKIMINININIITKVTLHDMKDELGKKYFIFTFWNTIKLRK